MIGPEFVIITCVGPIRALPWDIFSQGKLGERISFISGEAELKGCNAESWVETWVMPGAEEERRAGLVSAVLEPSFLQFSELDWLTS